MTLMDVATVLMAATMLGGVVFMVVVDATADRHMLSARDRRTFDEAFGYVPTRHRPAPPAPPESPADRLLREWQERLDARG